MLLMVTVLYVSCHDVCIIVTKQTQKHGPHNQDSHLQIMVCVFSVCTFLRSVPSCILRHPGSHGVVMAAEKHGWARWVLIEGYLPAPHKIHTVHLILARWVLIEGEVPAPHKIHPVHLTLARWVLIEGEVPTPHKIHPVHLTLTRWVLIEGEYHLLIKYTLFTWHFQGECWLRVGVPAPHKIHTVHSTLWHFS